MRTRDRACFTCPALPAIVPILLLALLAGCNRGSGPNVLTVYCAVDEPYASKIFEDFEKQTGIRIAPLYDIESSKSIGLGGKLEAEQDHPRADVWWGGEAFLTTRLADEGIFQKYASPAAADIDRKFKDPDGMWAGVGLRARVLAVGVPAPPFKIKGLADLLDPRLKDKIAMSRPNAGVTGAHLAAMYAIWGPDRARDFLHKLRANGVTLLGGNAEVADQVGAGSYALGLTDNDDVANAIANGGKLTGVIPDQSGEGTLAMPTTVALVKGSSHPELAKKLIDFLLSKQCEKELIDLGLAQWSVRAGPHGIKAIDLDYRKAAEVFPQAMRDGTAILEGHE
jgi:iron(III) transport system substrate-binding protein